jgi:TolB-like protein
VISSVRYLFENYVLDAALRELRQESTVLAVEPQVFDLLELLLTNRNRVVTRAELIERIWVGRIVSESSIAARINAARTAIGDNGKDQRLIKTFVRKGLRFIGAVEEEQKFEPPSSFPIRVEIAAPPLASTLPTESRLPSIAVLPFRSLGKTHESDYFSEGIVEDIVLSLASLGELFVISRGTTLSFRGNNVDVLKVAQQLNVRYVLSGGVGYSGKKLRIWAELTDATSGAAVWADRFDASRRDVFAVQDQIVSDIVVQLAPHIREAELKLALRKPPTSYSAYDHVLRALDCFYSLKMNHFEDAHSWLKNAQRVDPAFGLAFAWDAWLRMYRVALGWSRNEKGDIAEAAGLAEHAINLDSRSARALATYGHLRSLFHQDYDVGAHYLKRALHVCPNDPLAWALSSATSSYSCRPEQAIREAEQALRLSPLDRYRFFYIGTVLIAHYVNRDYNKAVDWGRIAVRENPGYTPNLRYLAAALAARGDRREAQNVAQTLLNRHPSFTLKSYEARYQLFRDVDQRKDHLDHLRLAGLP